VNVRRRLLESLKRGKLGDAVVAISLLLVGLMAATSWMVLLAPNNWVVFSLTDWELIADIVASTVVVILLAYIVYHRLRAW